MRYHSILYNIFGMVCHTLQSYKYIKENVIDCYHQGLPIFRGPCPQGEFTLSPLKD
jgi:hypothetical protein